MTYCENCGAAVKAGDAFCENCGAPITPARGEIPPPAAEGGPHPEPAGKEQGDIAGPAREKNAPLAAIASLLFSGLGQVYNGSFGKGLMIFVGTLIGLLIFIIPGILVLGYGIYDAYTTAKKMNEGQIPFVPHQNSHIIAFIIIGVVIMGIYLTVLAGIGGLIGF